MLLRNLTGTSHARWLVCLPLSCSLLLTGAASGQSMDAARTALSEGRFLEAAEIGEALNTSDGYALAAEALAIHGHYLAAEDTRTELLDRAMQVGQEAIRSDSKRFGESCGAPSACPRHGALYAGGGHAEGQA